MNNLNLVPLYPEIFLLGASCLILVVDMFLPPARRCVTYYLSLAALIGCAILTFSSFDASLNVIRTFHSMFIADPIAHLLKLFSYLCVGLTFIYSRQYVTDRGMSGGVLGGEFYVLALLALLGQMVMISADNMLIIYLGLELMSLSLYALAALRRESPMSTEAAMKYFILGALASGFLLYGISMLYGATGTLSLPELMKIIGVYNPNRMIMVFGIVFIAAGLAFKLGVAPFHMWVPDVYQGAPTAVVLLIAAAPKLATFAISLRLLVSGLLPYVLDWQQMLTVLAVLSMAIGNIAALGQTNIKRMLAYSSIAQMGFMLLGLANGAGITGNNLTLSISAYSGALFYTITYVVTTLGSFGIVLLLSRVNFEAENLDDFKGLSQRSPWFAFLMLVLMFSLAGIPPTIGFYAKLSVIQAVINNGQIWLALLAILFSLIGAFYYLKIIKLMYFDEPAEKSPLIANRDMRLVLSVNGLAVLGLGLLPGSLMSLCSTILTKTLIF